MEGEEDDFGEIYRDNLLHISSLEKPISSDSPIPSSFTSQNEAPTNLLGSNLSTVSSEVPNLSTGDREEPILKDYLHDNEKAAADTHLEKGDRIGEDEDDVFLGSSEGLNGQGSGKDRNLIRVLENDEGLSSTKPTDEAKNSDLGENLFSGVEVSSNVQEHQDRVVMEYGILNGQILDRKSNVKEKNEGFPFAKPTNAGESESLAKYFLFDEYGSNQEAMKSFALTSEKDDAKVDKNMEMDITIESECKIDEQHGEEDEASEKSLNIMLNEDETFDEVSPGENRIKKLEEENELDKDLGSAELGNNEMKEKNQKSNLNGDSNGITGTSFQISLNQDHTSQPLSKFITPDAFPPFNASNASTCQKPVFRLPPDRTSFDIDLDRFKEKRWREPGVDISDYFNFGLDENTWKTYCKQMKQLLGVKNQAGMPTRDRTPYTNLNQTSRDSEDIIKIVFQDSVDDIDLKNKEFNEDPHHNWRGRSTNSHRNASGDRFLPNPLYGTFQLLPHPNYIRPPINQHKRMSTYDMKQPLWNFDFRTTARNDWMVHPDSREKLKGRHCSYPSRRGVNFAEPSRSNGCDDLSDERRRRFSRDGVKNRRKLEERDTRRKFKRPRDVKNFKPPEDRRMAVGKRINMGGEGNRIMKKKGKGQIVERRLNSKRGQSIGPTRTQPQNQKLKKDTAKMKFVMEEDSDKMKKRGERFKPPESRWANRRPENELRNLLQHAADLDLKSRRPARKRKWASSLN